MVGVYVWFGCFCCNFALFLREWEGSDVKTETSAKQKQPVQQASNHRQLLWVWSVCYKNHYV